MGYVSPEMIEILNQTKKHADLYYNDMYGLRKSAQSL